MGALGFPTFNRHGDLLDLLARAGVLVVSVANNHALDQGAEGLQATIRAARARGLGVVGGWLPGEPAEGVERLRLGDLKVAVLGVTSGLNRPWDGAAPLDVVPFDAYPMDEAGVRILVPERLAGHLRPRPYLAAGLDATYVRLDWWQAGQRAHSSGWGAGGHVGIGSALDLAPGWSMGLEGRWSWTRIDLGRRERAGLWSETPEVSFGGPAVLVGAGWRF